ncbi:MAG TPA: glycosyltransferase family 2 protein [Candidatus Acidoferrum sp.]|nr:glycosyltransferase family 2 protein [Candidatus Acidoferrum sp.]
MSTTPVVSIVIPTRNRAALLRRALESVVGQTYRPLEVIVVDDASTDATGETVKAFAAAHPDLQLRYVRHEARQGGARARNVGIARATADFVAFLDDDDEWLPDKTSRQVSFLQSHARHVAVSCLFVRQGAHTARRAKIGGRRSSTPAEVTLDELQWGNVCGSFSFAMARRSALRRSGGITDDLASCQDWDFWLRMSEVGPIHVLQHHLATYHDEVRDRISRRYDDIYRGYRRAYLRHAGRFSRPCRRRHLKYLLHLQYRIARGGRARVRALERELRRGFPLFALIDAVHFVLPPRLFALSRGIATKLGLFLGDTTLMPGGVPEPRR